MSRRNREYVELLHNDFDESKYISFIKDLLNLSNTDINLNYTEIKPSQKQYNEDIKYYKYFAKYKDGFNNIGAFIVNIRSTNERSKQRNFIANLMKDYGLDACLVAFISDNDSSWRISFVRKELSFTDKGIKQDITPARRYSYLVGKNESVHTAQEYLLKLLDIEDRRIKIEDIESVFDVEKVTKRFFEEYKEQFLKLQEYLDKNKDFKTESIKYDFDSIEFAKRLMGQIVFLYFLQKKGWLGVQLVPEELSKEEFNILIDSNDSVCQNLLNEFYELNNDIYKIKRNELRNAIENDVTNFTNIFINSKYDMSWGTGDKQFIRTIYTRSQVEHKNFFDDYLEPFFYDGLNHKRDNQYFALFNCKIPFLNGGLFEPLNDYRWSSAEFNIPNKYFSNDDKTGILDFLDLYNFTIDEEEPLEKEIAVDPEMLGKIFENLLEVNDRKSKGAFYTPREIVYYMCQESLANYLVNKVGTNYDETIQFIKYGDLISQIDTEYSDSNDYQFKIGSTILYNLLAIDSALENVKVADPAVGSGAFPLGILTEIVKARNIISTYVIFAHDKGLISDDEFNSFKYKDIYELKKETIENCIYAVDIELSAVDIAKLRLWLSLIVDYPNDLEPKPLPNLDCKIMQGNSLIDEYEGIPLFSERLFKNSQRKNASHVPIQQNIFGEPSGIVIQQKIIFDDEEADISLYIDEMLKFQKQYFSVADSKLKKELKSKIDKIQIGMIEESLKSNLNKLDSFKKIADKRQKPWFIWRLEFFDVFKNNGGFDIVIGNPPYIKEGKNSNVFKGLKNNKYYKGKMDFWYFFTCLGLDLLIENGTLCFIAPNNWITSFGASIMRNKILNETEIKKFIDFNNFMVFDSASIQTMIMLLNKKNKRKYLVDYRKIISEDFSKSDINNMLNLNNDKELFVSENISFNSFDYIDEYIQFSYGIDGKLIEKIKSKGNFFITKDDISQGIVMPQDVLNSKNAEKLGKGYKKGDGVFVVDNFEKNSMDLNEKENNIIKPYFTSENIYKYWFDENNKNWIIYTNKNVISHINDFPNIKKHLERYGSIITSDNKPYGLHRPRNSYFFEGKKIICYRKCSEPTFCYCNCSAYVSQTYNIIKTDKIDLKYLCALLNSKLIKFWLKKCGKLQGNNYQLDSEPLMKIPICIPELSKIDLIDNLFKKVIESEGKDKDSIANIDNIIYEIYSLNQNEIGIINDEFK